MYVTTFVNKAVKLHINQDCLFVLPIMTRRVRLKSMLLYYQAYNCTLHSNHPFNIILGYTLAANWLLFDTYKLYFQAREVKQIWQICWSDENVVQKENAYIL